MEPCQLLRAPTRQVVTNTMCCSCPSRAGNRIGGDARASWLPPASEGTTSLATREIKSNGSVRHRRRRISFALAEGGRSQGSDPALPAATFALTEKILCLWETRQRAGQARRKRSCAAQVGAPPAPPSTTEEEAVKSGESGDDTFNWATNWYPVVPEIDMDRRVPYPFQILGRKVVFWHDGSAWSCALDVCPHRLAPLSEGRVDEQGCLQCSYHGWSFRADGSCANIPQARKEGPESKACDQSRARAVTLPVEVQQGILFVWPDEKLPELAKETEPPITPEIDEAAGWCGVGTFRDLPYGYDTGMENLADPSHIPVAHHNVNGGIMGKRSQAAALDLEVKRTGPWGFEAEMKKPVGPPSVHKFVAPARFTYSFQLGKKEGARGATTTYCTPTSPGNCRIVVMNARNFAVGFSSGPNWWQVFPRWLDHQMMLNLLDGDATLLHEQERYLRRATDEKLDKWSKAYFMPTTADRYVGAFRQWLTRFAGKEVKWAEGVDPSLPPLITKREDLLNRYESHTKQCQECSRALANFELVRKLLFLLAAGCLAVGAVLADPASRVRAVSFAAVSGLLGWWLRGWIQMFYYKGYDHARIP